MKVRIGGHYITISMVEQVDDKESAGEFDPVGQTIRILEDLRPSMRVEAFLHELIHAILSGLPISDEMEEVVTCVLGSGLCAFFRDNPDCVCMLLKALTDEEDKNG